MKNYDICRDVNEFYFKNYASIALAVPRFFDTLSEEGAEIENLKNMIDQGRLDEAIAQAEQDLVRFPPYTQHAFLAMQIFALWQQGKVGNRDLIDYFTSLEEILPDDPTVHFDKAAIHVRDKNFNAAVTELQKARKKDPNHVLSIALLFLIYYFARDNQWRPLFKIMADHKLVQDTIINLVTVVEGIKDGKTTDFYLSADKERLATSNEELLASFPETIIGKAPTRDKILFIAAESLYLREYGVPLFLSTLEIADRDFGVHVHLYDPADIDLEILRGYDEKFPHLYLSYSFEKDIPATGAGKLDYYASMRFVRACEILERNGSIRTLAVIDADALIRKNPFAREDVKNSDITITGTYEAAPSWERFAGGFSCFSNTEKGRAAIGYVANIILKNFAAKKQFWFIDQVALFDMHNNFASKAAIHAVTMDDFFGPGMQHTSDATAWTYTHEDKNRDNPMNRERVRLFSQYGIQFKIAPG